MPTLSTFLWPISGSEDSIFENVPNDKSPVAKQEDHLLTYVTYSPFFLLLLGGVPIPNDMKQFLISSGGTTFVNDYILHFREASIVGLCGMIGLAFLDLSISRKSKSLLFVGANLLLLTLMGMTYVFYAFLTL